MLTVIKAQPKHYQCHFLGINISLQKFSWLNKENKLGKRKEILTVQAKNNKPRTKTATLKSTLEWI
jgi:hypothetical protein